MAKISHNEAASRLRARRSRVYYTLLERLPGQLWAPQFGDWDRATVAQEGDDMRESGSFVRGTKFKIIETDGSQQSISEAVRKINDSIETRRAALTENNEARRDVASFILGGGKFGAIK